MAWNTFIAVSSYCPVIAIAAVYKWMSIRVHMRSIQKSMWSNGKSNENIHNCEHVTVCAVKSHAPHPLPCADVDVIIKQYSGSGEQIFNPEEWSDRQKKSINNKKKNDFISFLFSYRSSSKSSSSSWMCWRTHTWTGAHRDDSKLTWKWVCAIERVFCFQAKAIHRFRFFCPFPPNAGTTSSQNGKNIKIYLYAPKSPNSSEWKFKLDQSFAERFWVCVFVYVSVCVSECMRVFVSQNIIHANMSRGRTASK